MFEDALMAATIREFGEKEVNDFLTSRQKNQSKNEASQSNQVVKEMPTRVPWSAHFTFLIFLVLGGVAGSTIRGTFSLQFDLGDFHTQMIGFFLFFKNKKLSQKSYIKGTIPGSVLFCVGWAITAACPSIALVQLGEGKLAALVTIFGIYIGVWLFRRFVIANPSFDNGICGEE